MKWLSQSLFVAGLGSVALLGALGMDQCPQEPECETASDCGDYMSCVDGQCVYTCEAEGGEVSTGLCCESVGDFPNNCLIGACGCAPEYSHEVLTCTCPQGMCWDGSHCVKAPYPY